MKKKLIKLREKLKNNEIFFTTIMTLLLSLMAIVVTVNSNKLLKNQIEVERMINQPDFYVSHEYVLNEETGSFDDVEIYIKKLSGVAKNVEITSVSLFNISFTDSLNKRCEVIFELQHMYDQSYSGYNLESNVIKKLKGYKNNLKLSNFQKSIEVEMKVMGNKYISSKAKTIIKISYQDFSGDLKEEFYESSFRDGIKLNGDHNHDLEMKSAAEQIYLQDIDLMNISDIANRIVSICN